MEPPLPPEGTPPAGGKARGAGLGVLAGAALRSLVAAPEGVARLTDYHPDVPIYTAALDRQLDENAFIRPGLGDAGDRIFGTT